MIYAFVVYAFNYFCFHVKNIHFYIIIKLLIDVLIIRKFFNETMILLFKFKILCNVNKCELCFKNYQLILKMHFYFLYINYINYINNNQYKICNFR